MYQLTESQPHWRRPRLRLRARAEAGDTAGAAAALLARAALPSTGFRALKNSIGVKMPRSPPARSVRAPGSGRQLQVQASLMSW